MHFSATYSYGEEALRPLALLHYKTLLQFEPDYPMALNNVGVEYKHLGMPINAVKCYKKAAELNETLAMANIAYQFLDAGFEEEASQILYKAKEQDKPHANVARATSAASDRNETESKREESVIIDAREQQRFILAFAEAYFAGKPSLPTFSGIWRSSDDIETEITETDSRIEANWKRDTKRYKFTGIVSNRGAKITVYKEEYVFWPKTELKFIVDSSGYAYLTPNGQQLLIMTLKEGKHTFMELTKKS